MTTIGAPPQSLLLSAALRQKAARAPVWIMRQAGRYLPEYRAVREKADFLTMCRTPELAAEVTVQPVRRLGVDAAILFSDILIPLEAMGLEVVFTEKGPRLENPVRTAADVARLRVPVPQEDLPFVAEAIKLVKQEVSVPVIGFAGAPFTLAAYSVDGGGSKDYSKTKKLMAADPELFRTLLDKLADTVAASLVAQVEAGASMVQVFDSWGGYLSEQDWRAFALPATRKIVAAVHEKAGVPVTLYVGMTPHLVEAMAETGADVLSVDWRTNIGKVLDRHGDKVAVQGNMDPTLLYAAPERIAAEVARIRAQVAGRPHIWNLGHGILPDIPVEHAQAFVRAAQNG